MARKTQMNDITSPELLDQINPDNKQLVEDYLMYLKSIQRSENTIKSYKNDLDIFFVWVLQHTKNKFYIDITKRDIVSYQNWLLTENNNSPARIRRLKSTLSSLGNYIEAVLDDEFPNYKNFINKIENPTNQAVRTKTILSDEQVESLIHYFVEKKKYDKACMFACAAMTGRRKSELPRLKVDYFTEDTLICGGSLYKSYETVKTKGRGLNGKQLPVYALAKQFKPYYDLWMNYRKENGIESEWLFPDKKDTTKQMKSETLNSWASTASKILGIDFYFHAMRHYFTTHLARLGLPDNIIQEIVGWESQDMVKIYKDISTDEQLGEYFDENGIKENNKKGLSDL